MNATTPELRSPLVKFCGLRTQSDVAAALAAGADAVGFVLCASPRCVTRGEVTPLLEQATGKALRVAVMGRPSAALLALANSLPFDAVQCECCNLPTPRLRAGRFLLPAFRDSQDVSERVAAFLARASDRGGKNPFEGAFVLDGPKGGGKGIAPDNKRALRLARTGRMILAGGLTPDTVAASVRIIAPLAVDVSSGVEHTPGHKDAELMQRFARAAREAHANQGESSSTTFPSNESHGRNPLE